MILIGDFVDHRWMDAKEILRKQDPDLVRKVETRGQSEHDWLTPASGLSSKWHTLWAACDELHLLASMVQAAGGYVNRCVNDIRRRPSQPLIQWRFHPHTVHRGRCLRSTQGPSDA